MMEEFGSGPRFDSLTSAVRRKRSQTFRRPRPDSPISSNPNSDEVLASSDENNGGDLNSNRKEFSLNQCISRASSSSGGFDSYYNNNEPKRSSEGVLAPANWKGNNTSTVNVNESVETESRSVEVFGGWSGEQSSGHVDEFGTNENNKVKKVKLKVGGVTRTIQPNSASNGKSSRYPDASRQRQKNSLEGNSEEYVSSSDKGVSLQGVPWKDFSKGGGGFILGNAMGVKGNNNNSNNNNNNNNSSNNNNKSEPVRKSRRVPKRRVLDSEFGDDDDEDDEIRYLEKLKMSKVSPSFREDEEEEPSKKHRKLSAVSENGSRSVAKDGKRKSRATDRVLSGDTDYEEEDESPSDGEVDGKKSKKKPRKEAVVDLVTEGKREITLTTRQRALQSSKDASSNPGSSLIEFPNGLPPAPSRKQKEKLTEVEQQLKKAEAAQRRKVQVEKAARESEAEAIRKILGQDSSRKKKEDKIKKRQEELAQSKAASALLNASNTVRWVMGPTGTVVTFSEEMGLPSIFNPKPHGYPPPRENCAGPACPNPYKYRDSKSKLPLCSLQCYKAVQAKLQSEATC